MSVSINTRQAYSEVDEFLKLLSDEQINKIPQKLRDFFKEEKDQNYKKEINLKSPIKNQFMQKTKKNIKRYYKKNIVQRIYLKDILQDQKKNIPQ